MNRIILRTTALLFLTVLLASWGWSGHKKINKKSALSFPFEMGAFVVWADSLANHASDADDRKYTDSTESPKHYIDIDSYAEFVSDGRIPSTLDSVINIHGFYFVYNTGILPWATMATYDSLKNAFIMHDWNKAMLFASDLGHYVADGHMPLHLTTNYDGQLTGQDGVHSRYESDLIWYYISQISITGEAVHYVPDVNQYVFGYIYNNFSYADSVLLADDYAYNQAGNDTTMAYYQAFWGRSANFTKQLFQRASVSLAELIYSAWYQAGSPVFGSGLGIGNTAHENCIIKDACYLPATGNIQYRIMVQPGNTYQIVLFDVCGKKAGECSLTASCSETVTASLGSGGLNPGLYFLKVNNGLRSESLKVTVY